MKYDVILAGITFNADLMAKIIAALDYRLTIRPFFYY